MNVTHGLGPFSLADGDCYRWRIRQECERVGCTAPVMLVIDPHEEQIRHGDRTYQLMGGPYRSKWAGLVGWLDTLHAAEQQPKAA